MAIEQFIDNEVKIERRSAVHEGHAAIADVRIFGPSGANSRSSRRELQGLERAQNSEDLRQAVKSYSNWPTIPQLYVEGEFLGGCDIIREMFQAGELQSLLKDKGVPADEGASA